MIDEVRALVNKYAPELELQTVNGAKSLPGLLERCKQLSAEAKNAEPIRTTHHFACTGGSLIIKCLASMPNTQILSEVDPLSTINDNSTKRFFPTDLVKLTQLSTRGADERLLEEIFVSGLAAIYDDATRKGQRLVIRDHTHSHFCVGPEIPSRPTLQSIIRNRYLCHSIVTVRHPVDSFLSLYWKGWCHFQPDSIDEYCRRYMAFLDCYRDTRIFRYEDLVAGPDVVMEGICKELVIPYYQSFMDVFYIHQISGDSGRSGSDIEIRPRRSIPEEMAGQISHSTLLNELCDRLGYSMDFSSNTGSR